MIRVLVLCSQGLSSNILVRRLSEAARERGISLEARARSVWNREEWSPADVILLEPQVAHLRSKLTPYAERTGAVLDRVETTAFLTMDGHRVLNGILRLLTERNGD
ncbi:PTS sugar transporter subunit IIB [Staphylospora marina]|uniref:PTS sugar transporter subunit IIB n=1 Tax=Staphylospora marina TaxID=2490858 RepID=UPI001F150E31|nr:hypothetical protein [Staphylospora marina]